MYHTLPHYHRILLKETIPHFQFSKLHPVSFSKTDSTKKLWKQHTQALSLLHPQDVPPKQSLLDLKFELAERLYSQCEFCEHRCRINRHTTTGQCNVSEPNIASEFLHLGEEPPLVPSHTIFFSGCTFKCVFCQNYDISQTISGHNIPPLELTQIINHRYSHGAKNVNWVGGDPTSNLPFILSILKHLTLDIPQIWNSNMYCSTETMQLLQGVIDVYLTDYKYGNDTCAQRLSKIPDYTRIIQRNHLQAYQQTDVLIRHLVLPNHLDCCSQPILQWIQKHTPDAAVNIMAQYHPTYQSHNYADIKKPLSSDEHIKIRNQAQKYHLNLI